MDIACNAWIVIVCKAWIDTVYRAWTEIVFSIFNFGIVKAAKPYYYPFQCISQIPKQLPLTLLVLSLIFSCID